MPTTKFIDSKLILFSLLFSFASVIYIDVLALDSRGVYVSLALFCAVALLAIFRTELAILSVIILQIAIPAYPRNILDVYSELLVTKSVAFNTICSISVAKLSLIQHLTFFVALVVMYRLVFSVGEITVSSRMKQYWLALLVCPLGATIFFNYFHHDVNPFREIITSTRLILYLTIGIIYFNYLYHWCGLERTIHLVGRTFIALTIIMGARVPFLVFMDLKTGQPSLDVAVVPHIPIVAFIACFFLMERDRENRKAYLLFMALSFFALLSPSRGHIALMLISIGVFILVTGFRPRYGKYLALMALMLTIPVVFIYFFNERLFSFILWKLTFFRGEISDSGLVRIYEFYNIVAEGLANPLYLLFGKGVTGYFTFDTHPLPLRIVLDLKSYSLEEVTTGKIYHPHFFVNYLLLKYGLVGLTVYVAMVYEFFRMGRRTLGRIRSHGEAPPSLLFFATANTVLSVSMLFEMFFRNYYALIFVVNYLILYFYLRRSEQESLACTCPVTHNAH